MDCLACGRPFSEHPPIPGEFGLPFHACPIDGPGYTARPQGIGIAADQAELEFQRARGKLLNERQGLTVPQPHGQNWDFVHHELREWLQPLCEEYGCGLTSGHRTYAEQDYLYWGYVTGRPGFAPANPPGGSNHEAEPGPESIVEAALAVDLSGPVTTMLADPRSRGHRPIADELWHVQDLRTPSGRWMGWGAMGPPSVPSTERDPDMPKFRYNDVRGHAWVGDWGERWAIQTPGINDFLGRTKLRHGGESFDACPPIWGDEPTPQVLQDDVHLSMDEKRPPRSLAGMTDEPPQKFHVINGAPWTAEDDEKVAQLPPL